MKTVIKYELRKIFNSRVTSVVLLVAFIISVCVAGVNAIQYKSGEKGYYKLNDMNGNPFPESLVSSENIDELVSKLKVFESRDEIYETDAKTVNTYAGLTFKGKYDIDKSALNKAVSIGELTNQEYHQALKDYQSAPCIKEEYLAEYFELYYPVYCYNNISNQLESTFQRLIEDDLGDLYEISKLAKAIREEQALNKGVVFTYDYGWSLGEDMISYLSPVYLIVVIFGLCNMFSAEYSLGIDSLIKSTKYGKRKFVTMKFISAAIYCIVCSAVMLFVCYLPSLCLLGFSGYNVGTDYTNIEFALLKFVTLAVSGLCAGCVVMLFSSFFNKLSNVLVASTVTVIIPYIILFIPSLDFVYQIVFHLLPVPFAIDTYWLIDNFISINFTELFCFAPAVLFNLLISFAIYLATVKAFSKHKIMN